MGKIIGQQNNASDIKEKKERKEELITRSNEYKPPNVETI